MSTSIWSVKALNQYLKSKLESDLFLHGLSVKGEISNFTNHSSGHYYFTLKDSTSTISCVMFASYASKNKLIITNGMKVVLTGSISVYEAAGKVQLYVTKIEEDGIGNYYLLFEEIKNRLALEGLFDERHKKSIPSYPTRIAVITGENTAALQDVRTTIASRWPIAVLDEFYCLVQGKQAANEIIHQLELVDEQHYDVIILARGGGSIEDLWAFNEESLARCIYQLKTPLITGIGHETDTTIADFVSDVRAATPTAAAQKATNNRSDVLDKINQNENIMLISINKIIESNNMHLINIQHELTNYQQGIKVKQMNIDNITQRLAMQLSTFITDNKNQINNQKNNLIKTLEFYTQRNRNHFSTTINQLNILSPLNTLQRGYSITSNHEKVITSINDVQVHDELVTKVTDGIIISNIIKIDK